MIVAHARGRSKKGHPRNVLVLGVTAGNIERLQRGEPILIDDEHAGFWALPAGWNVLIVAGDNPQDIINQFREAGAEIRFGGPAPDGTNG